MTSRRKFLEQSAVSAIGLSLPRWRFVGAQTPPRGFLDLRRPPDAIRVQTATGEEHLRPGAGGRWEVGDLAVTVSDKNIIDLCKLSVSGAHEFFRQACEARPEAAPQQENKRSAA